jgi:Tol biopolymer transport system component
MFALDWRSGEVEQLVKGPLVSGYSPKDFTWNPQMTRGVQEMVDGAQGTINWISPEGVSPMDIEIEDQGLKWNLKDYYENHYSFEKGTGFVLSPAWSPDGKTIAFLVSTYGMREKPRLRANIRYEIYFMDPIELKPVQAVRGIVNAYRLRWSPDSKHLLFGGCLESKCGLWIYNLERETIVLVTEGEFFNSIWKTNNEIVAIKNTNGYLKEAEIWEYSVDELLKQ